MVIFLISFYPALKKSWIRKKPQLVSSRRFFYPCLQYVVNFFGVFTILSKLSYMFAT